MKIVSSTEIKTNLGKYLNSLENGDEDVIITRNGKMFARLSLYDKKDSWIKIQEILNRSKSVDVSDEEVKSERLKKYL